MSSEMKESSLQITGMTCAACASRIEKGLNKMDGVNEANVNLALEKSSVKYDPSKLSEADLENKIEALGYGVVKQKMEFDITGMTCAACANRIEKVLSKMEGIATTNVNLALEKATVEFNPSEVAIADIITKVEKLGYGAHRKEDGQESVDHREKVDSKAKTQIYPFSYFVIPIVLDDGGSFFFYIVSICYRIS